VVLPLLLQRILDLEQVGEVACGVEPHYQIVIDRGSDYMDELDVLVEVQAQVYGNPEHLIQLEKRLSFEVQSALGITCNVKLVAPRAIERSEGKAMRVVDRRTI
jgi:phenylacetate-CoA ligase